MNFSFNSNKLPCSNTTQMAIFLIIITATSTVVVGTDRPRPDPKGHPAAFARWLVSEASWCVLSTIDYEGYPFGNIISYTDGGTGIPFFYLTTSLDPTGKFALKDQRASFAISERQLGTCGNQDPQSPACSKISITGQLVLVQFNKTEKVFGETALFLTHPQLSGWPKNSKKFDVFKLIPTKIFLVNDFKPAKKLTVEEYLRYKFL